MSSGSSSHNSSSKADQLDLNHVQSKSVRDAVGGLLAGEQIAVIGARGRLGRALVAAAYESSQVRVIAIDVAGISAVDEQSTRAKHIVGDVRDEEGLVKAMQGVSVVFLCSAIIDLNPWTPHKARIHDVNVGGAVRTLNAARRVGARALIFTSSIDAQLIYRGDSDVLDGDESHPPWSGEAKDHSNQYALTKAIAEKLVLDADDRGAMRTAALRPVHIYAAGDPMIEFAVDLSRTPLLRNFWLVTRGTVHDVVYVENLAVAHLLLARKLLAQRGADECGGEVFLISDGAVNLNEQIAEFFPRGTVPPRFYVPRAVVIAVACIVELGLFIMSAIFGMAPKDPAQLFTRFAAHAVTSTVHFRVDKARRLLGEWNVCSRAEAIALIRKASNLD